MNNPNDIEFLIFVFFCIKLPLRDQLFPNIFYNYNNCCFNEIRKLCCMPVLHLICVIFCCSSVLMTEIFFRIENWTRCRCNEVWETLHIINLLWTDLIKPSLDISVLTTRLQRSRRSNWYLYRWVQMNIWPLYWALQAGQLFFKRLKSFF